MTDFARREARLKPEFAELYPGMTAGRWEPAVVMADRMAAWLLLHRKTVVSATERLLPAQHFEFRGDATRPASRPGGHTRHGDSQLHDLEREANDAKQDLADAERRADETLERAEQLQEKSQKLGEAGEEIRKKASEPIGFPPPPPHGKEKP